MRVVPALVKVAVLTAALALYLRREGQNVALHRPVSISSARLGDPRDAVNGVVEWGSYAVHTSREGAAWFLVDLERARAVGEVRVYGRGDQFYADDRTPIAIEVSLDGKKFRRAARCPAVVNQVAPCVVDLGGAAARFVRLVHPTHLVLSEVEVFEAR